MSCSQGVLQVRKGEIGFGMRIAFLSVGIFCALYALPMRADVLATASANEEGQLRAAMIVGILRFSSQYDHEGVEYPVCLAGAPPAAAALATAAGAPLAKQRPLKVMRLDAISSTDNCAALVVGPGIEKAAQQILAQQAIASSTILICDDCKDDALAHISLRRQGERIVFAVDIALAQHSQVTFSSRLLSLAAETRR